MLLETLYLFAIQLFPKFTLRVVVHIYARSEVFCRGFMILLCILMHNYLSFSSNCIAFDVCSGLAFTISVLFTVFTSASGLSL